MKKKTIIALLLVVLTITMTATATPALAAGRTMKQAKTGIGTTINTKKQKNIVPVKEQYEMYLKRFQKCYQELLESTPAYLLKGYVLAQDVLDMYPATYDDTAFDAVSIKNGSQWLHKASIVRLGGVEYIAGRDYFCLMAHIRCTAKYAWQYDLIPGYQPKVFWNGLVQSEEVCFAHYPMIEDRKFGNQYDGLVVVGCEVFNAPTVSYEGWEYISGKNCLQLLYWVEQMKTQPCEEMAKFIAKFPDSFLAQEVNYSWVKEKYPVEFKAIYNGQLIIGVEGCNWLFIQCYSPSYEENCITGKQFLQILFAVQYLQNP